MKKIVSFFKFIFSKFSTSKYIIKGKCHACGQCCRNIVFMNGDDYITTQKQFDVLREWDKKYNHFYISGKKNNDDNGALLFTCKSLGEDNRCKDYLLRSIYCRIYPKLNKKIILGGYETFEGCGYSIEIEKKFKDFLDFS